MLARSSGYRILNTKYEQKSISRAALKDFVDVLISPSNEKKYFFVLKMLSPAEQRKGIN